MRLALGVVAVLVAGGPAAADWQNTRWGMSVREAAASTGAAATTDSSRDAGGLSALLVKPYPIDEIEAEAVLLFEDGRLARVDLRPSDPNSSCILFAARAAETYGTPFRRDVNVVGILEQWRDEERGNLVTLVWSGSPADVVYCTLNYEPLPSPGTEGGL